MDTVRMIAMSICVTAVVTAMFSMLVPNTKFDKALKFAISLFFLTGLVSPFLSNRLDFHVDLGETEAPAVEQRMAAAAEESFLRLAEGKVAAGIENALAMEGIQTKKVTVSINIGEDGGISINKLTILLRQDAASKVELAGEIAERTAGVPPEVVCEAKR